MDNFANLIEQDVVFYDLVINFFMNNPALYDKMEEKYSFTVSKLDKLMVLSNYLKELNIHKSVPEIISAWQNLVKQFKNYSSQLNKIGSGSAPPLDKFPYYEDLLFLNPVLQHRPSISTATFPKEKHGPPTDYLMNKNMHSTFDAPSHSASCSIPPSRSSTSKSLTMSSCSAPESQLESLFACNKSKVSAPFTPSRKSQNVPKLDNFATKKAKLISENDKSVQIIATKLIETMDHVNRKLNCKQTSQESTISLSDREISNQQIDYKNHLIAAVEKIPNGYEDECMEYVLQGLQKFDEQQRSEQD